MQLFIIFALTLTAMTFAVPLKDTRFNKENQKRIINGQPAKNGQFPYQCLIIIDGRSMCGCSIISQNFLLTTAHCLRRFSNADVYMGSVNFAKGTRISITDFNAIKHPLFDPSSLEYNIAVIDLWQAIELNNFTQIISLPPIGTTEQYVGRTAIVSGWGKTSDLSNTGSDVLNAAEMTIISNEVCNKTYGPDRVGEGTICALSEKGMSTCNGDSGGPMVVNNEQIGITSFGSSRGCEYGDPAGFVRLSDWRYRYWIYSITGV